MSIFKTQWSQFVLWKLRRKLCVDMLLLCNINESVRFHLFIVDNNSDEPFYLFPDVGSLWMQLDYVCWDMPMYPDISIVRNWELCPGVGGKKINFQLQNCGKYTKMLQKLFHGCTTLCHLQDGSSKCTYCTDEKVMLEEMQRRHLIHTGREVRVGTDDGRRLPIGGNFKAWRKVGKSSVQNREKCVKRTTCWNERTVKASIQIRKAGGFCVSKGYNMWDVECEEVKAEK